MGGPGHMGGMGGGGPGNGPEPGSVLLIYGLASGKFNCDKLFNIMCIYGNVFRVSYHLQSLTLPAVLLLDC